MIIKSPNLLVTGTPGTGKSSICSKLLEQLKDRYVLLNVGDYAKQHQLLEERDEERDCDVLDEEALIAHLQEYINKEAKSIIFDYHGCDLFPAEWFQAVFVLRTSNDELYRRLEARSYSESKLKENVECEIFQVILDEAREAFEEDEMKIVELENNTEQDQVRNVEAILDWIKSKN